MDSRLSVFLVVVVGVVSGVAVVELGPFGFQPNNSAINVTVSSSPNQNTVPDTGERYVLTASVAGGASPYSYSWSFGDGSTGTGNPVTHTYPGFVSTAKGCYSATVTVTDSKGLTGSASVDLNGFGGHC